MMKNTRNIFLLSILQILFVADMYPQVADIKFDHLTTDDGLSHNWICCIMQDSEGFMWLGTFAGLNRYDGYQFQVFKHDPSDPTSISHDWVISLCEDDSGYVYAGTRGGGLNKYDKYTGKFTHLKVGPDSSPDLSLMNVNVLLNDKKGCIWIGAEKSGLYN